MSSSDDDDDVLPAKRKFTAAENDWLLDRVTKHPQKAQLLSAVRKDKQRKLELWTALQESFIKSGVSSRDWSVDQVMTWWKNKCSKAKKKKAAHKAAVTKTGGGPPPPVLPAEAEQVMDLMGDAVKPLDNPHDSDAAFFSKDETVPADKWSIGKNVDVDILHVAGQTHKKKERKPSVTQQAVAEAWREEEHEWIVKKLKLECAVLEKKGTYLDMKLQEQKKKEEAVQPAAAHAGCSSVNGYNPRTLFTPPSRGHLSQADYSSSGLIGFNYSSPSDAFAVNDD